MRAIRMCAAAAAALTAQALAQTPAAGDEPTPPRHIVHGRVVHGRTILHPPNGIKVRKPKPVPPDQNPPPPDNPPPADNPAAPDTPK